MTAPPPHGRRQVEKVSSQDRQLDAFGVLEAEYDLRLASSHREASSEETQ